MLVLRRKAGEAIVLNGAITIYVLAVEGERVKLGISAPPEVVIVRSELLDGPMAGPVPGGMSGPLGGPPLPPGGSGSSYPRPPRPPERTWRDAGSSGWREPRPPLPPRHPDHPDRHEDDDSDPGFSGPSRYTPRSRYDIHAPYTSHNPGDERDAFSPLDGEPAAPGDDQEPPRRR